MTNNSFFEQIEQFGAPSTILWRSIELALLKKRLSKLPKTGVILDLGCGEGLTASLLFNRKITYGLDNNSHFAKLAKKSGVYKKVFLADARKVPLPDKSVNLIFSNSVLEHIKDYKSALQETARILKKGGYFLFTAPNENFQKYSLFSRIGLNSLSRIYGRLREQKFSHYNCFSLKKWRQILAQHQLKVIDIYYYLNKPAVEFWDFLLILFFLLKKINLRLSRWVYKKYFRKKIYNFFLSAETTSAKGAAVCLIAKKI